MYSVLYVIYGSILSIAFKSAGLNFHMWETWSIIGVVIAVLITTTLNMLR